MTEYIINGTALKQEWLYADFFINDSHYNTLSAEQPEVDEFGHLNLVVNHRRNEDVKLAEHSRSIILYDHYGQAYSIGVLGGCQHINEAPNRRSSSILVVEENKDTATCGFTNQLNLMDTGCKKSKKTVHSIMLATTHIDRKSHLSQKVEYLS